LDIRINLTNQYEKYLVSPDEYVEPFEQQLGIKINGTQFKQDNIPFIELQELLKENKHEFGNINYSVEVMHSLFLNGAGFDLEVVNEVVIEHEDGSEMRICSERENDLQILYVEGNKGLMVMKLLSINLTSKPNVHYEIVGQTTIKNKAQLEPISTQIEFWKGLGFETTRSKRSYTRMMFCPHTTSFI
jgi:hypothetical protein